MVAPLLVLVSVSRAALIGMSAPGTAPIAAPAVSVPALPSSSLAPALAGDFRSRAEISAAAPVELPRADTASIPRAQAAAPNSSPSGASGAAGAPQPPQGRGAVVVVDDFRSGILGNSRSVAVYLPPGYEAGGRRYPVLYAQDGQNLFDARTAYGGVDWGLGETCDRLIAAGEMEPVIIVAPYNTPERLAEYTPVPDAGEGGGGRGDLYGRFLAEELKPWIDARLRTKTGAADTATMGSSLGGLISLHLALTRPDVFGRAGVVSPSLWWADREILRRVAFEAAGALPSPRPRLWADVGTREGPPQGQARHVKNLRTLAGLLARRGWTPGADLAARVYDGAEHNETAWRARVSDVLQFLFPPPVGP